MTTTRTYIEKIANVVVPVEDVDLAIAFYTERLGFEKRVDVPFGGKYRWVEVALPGGQTTIALAPPPEGKPAGNRETGISFYTADIEGFHASLAEAGVDVDAEISRMGGPVPPLFWLRDPEGNSLLVAGPVEQG